MRDAFGVERGERVSKVRLPVKWVRAMADGGKRDPARVVALRTKIAESGRIDPVAIHVYRGRPYLMNGHHRLEAAESLGRKTIPTRIRLGSYKAWKDPNS